MPVLDERGTTPWIARTAHSASATAVDRRRQPCTRSAPANKSRGTPSDFVRTLTTTSNCSRHRPGCKAERTCVSPPPSCCRETWSWRKLSGRRRSACSRAMRGRQSCRHGRRSTASSKTSSSPRTLACPTSSSGRGPCSRAGGRRPLSANSCSPAASSTAAWPRSCSTSGPSLDPRWSGRAAVFGRRAAVSVDNLTTSGAASSHVVLDGDDLKRSKAAAARSGRRIGYADRHGGVPDL